MKKKIALLLSAVMIFSSFTFCFAASTPYDDYTEISGRIEALTEGKIQKGGTFDVVVSVNFNDSIPIEQIVAFHFVGNCSDNLKISAFDFYDTSKKPANIVSEKMKDQTIDYTAAAALEEVAITAASDGYGRILKITFEALEGGSATVHLDGSYIRSAADNDLQYKRCLKVPDLTLTVSDDSDSNDDDSANGSQNSGNTGSTGNSSSSGSSSSGNSSQGSTNTNNSNKNENSQGSSSNVSTTAPSQPEKEEIVENTFADVEKSHWGYEFANELYNQKIVSGAGFDQNGNAILNPDFDITREEAVKLAVAASKIAVSGDFELLFADKAEISDWAQKYVFAAVNNEILSGYAENNTFRPKNKITREELVKIIVGAFGIEMSENADVSMFSDSDKITWSAPYIAAAVEDGIIKGYDDGSVKPSATVTRIEAITMFGRAMVK